MHTGWVAAIELRSKQLGQVTVLNKLEITRDDADHALGAIRDVDGWEGWGNSVFFSSTKGCRGLWRSMSRASMSRVRIAVCFAALLQSLTSQRLPVTSL